jgi:hypothetical protein
VAKPVAELARLAEVRAEDRPWSRQPREGRAARGRHSGNQQGELLCELRHGLDGMRLVKIVLMHSG